MTSSLRSQSIPSTKISKKEKDEITLKEENVVAQVIVIQTDN